MKRIILFALLASFGLTSISCSNDDNSTPVNQVPQAGGTITFKVGGVAKTFNTINVVEDEQGTTEDPYTVLMVTASANNNPAEVISFVLPKGQIGANLIYNLIYTVNGKSYWADTFGGSSTNVVQTNTADNKIIGSFSGTFTYSNMGQDFEELMITEGVFNFTY